VRRIACGTLSGLCCTSCHDDADGGWSSLGDARVELPGGGYWTNGACCLKGDRMERLMQRFVRRYCGNPLYIGGRTG